MTINSKNINNNISLNNVNVEYHNGYTLSALSILQFQIANFNSYKQEIKQNNVSNGIDKLRLYLVVFSLLYWV